MFKKFFFLAAVFSVLLAACGTQVTVSTNDTTPPTVGASFNDLDLIGFTQAAQSSSVIAASDVITIIGSAKDEDGGVKAVRIWATYTYYKPGQISGPGLVAQPIYERVSDTQPGGTASDLLIAQVNVDLRQELGSWSRIKADIWVEGENFSGLKAQSPTISISYPTRQEGDTDYMAYCRKVGVPIPPNLSQLSPIPIVGTQSTTGWVYQGKLQTNLLQPGSDAYVWTYSDSIRKGACIALPRGSGGQRGNLSGVICQSAITGRACFWDSRNRDDSNPLREMPAIDWASQPLVISKLKDASDLTEPGSGRCPDCHRGNNVFLISPDDPTWARVLRDPMATGNMFTTKVLYSGDNNGGHPRYSPVTYPASRPDWVNLYQAGGCAGTCHENPSLSFSTIPPGMAPNGPSCATNGNTTTCYKDNP